MSAMINQDNQNDISMWCIFLLDNQCWEFPQNFSTQPKGRNMRIRKLSQFRKIDGVANCFKIIAINFLKTISCFEISLTYWQWLKKKTTESICITKTHLYCGDCLALCTSCETKWREMLYKERHNLVATLSELDNLPSALNKKLLMDKGTSWTPGLGYLVVFSFLEDISPFCGPID